MQNTFELSKHKKKGNFERNRNTNMEHLLLVIIVKCISWLALLEFVSAKNKKENDEKMSGNAIFFAFVLGVNGVQPM